MFLAFSSADVLRSAERENKYYYILFYPRLSIDKFHYECTSMHVGMDRRQYPLNPSDGCRFVKPVNETKRFLSYQASPKNCRGIQTYLTAEEYKHILWKPTTVKCQV